MKKQKQKEPLSIMIAKTTLAIAVLTGLGTIIFGGGVVIMKYYNGEVNNRIVETTDQETGDYYDVLEEKCNTKCCLSSVDVMRKNNYKDLSKNEKCPDGFKMNSFPCTTAFQWCQPIENCLREGDIKFGITDECCGELKLVGDASYISEAKVCVSSQLGICLNCGNGICGLGENKCNCPEDCGEKPDTSDWKTYRNEEFGFEVKYPEDQLSSYHKNPGFLNDKITIKSVDDTKKDFEAMAATPSLKLKISKIVDRKIEILSEASDCAYPENFENDIKEVSDQLRKGIGKTAKVEGIYNDNLKKCGIKIIDNEGYSIIMDNYRYTAQFLENDQIITFSFSLFPENVFKDIDEFLAGLSYTDYENLYSSGDILDGEITAKTIERYDQIISSFRFIEN